MCAHEPQPQNRIIIILGIPYLSGGDVKANGLLGNGVAANGLLGKRFDLGGS
jgi:hypothetical protein